LLLNVIKNVQRDDPDDFEANRANLAEGVVRFIHMAKNRSTHLLGGRDIQAVSGTCCGIPYKAPFYVPMQLINHDGTKNTKF